jgi:hypothetical protein
MTMFKEMMSGPNGKRIREELATLRQQFDDEALRKLRNDGTSMEDVKYRVGCADGVLMALNHLMDCAKQ